MNAPFQDILANPANDATKYILQYTQKRAFRWLFVVEVLVGILMFLCLLPVIVLLTIFLGQHIHIDFAQLNQIEYRIYRKWVELSFLQKDKDGNVLAQSTYVPIDQQGLDAAVASVLMVAQNQERVIVESIGDELSEILTVWYGGSPYLASPTRMSPEITTALFNTHNLKEDTQKESWSIEIPDETQSRIEAFFFLLFGGFFMIWSSEGREQGSRLWRILRHNQQLLTHFSVNKEGITFQRRQGATVLSTKFFSTQEIVGISWSATLKMGNQPYRSTPKMRIIERSRTMEFRINEEIGKALSDRILCALLEFGADQHTFALRTHCPFCGTLYNIEEHECCISCGAAPIAKA